MMFLFDLYIYGHRLQFIFGCLNVVDVIGVMTAISAEREYVKDGKVCRMVILELTDDRYVNPVFYL
jgi:hypothetical protein